MVRVVIYARVSTEEQHQKEALVKQVDELVNFVSQQKDWVLVHKYVDEGKSGTTSVGRKEYNKLYAALETDKFDVVVVKDESRLMRNQLDWQLFKYRLITNDKRLYFYRQGEYFTTKNDLVMDINVAVAAQYSRDQSNKIALAAKYAQERGTIYGNSRIYGYVKDKARLVIDEKEAEVVRLIFKLYIEGYGFRTIQGILTEKGIYSSTGTPFSLSTMKRMIKQEKYCGVIVSHKTKTDFDKKTVTTLPPDEWIKIYDEERCPPIISREIFDKANAILAERCQANGAEEAKKRGAFQGNNYPLSGKIYCGKCGKVFWHEHYLTKTNKLPRNIWQCSKYKAYGVVNGCSNRKLDDAKIMVMLREILCEILHNDDAKAVLDIVISTTDDTQKDIGKRVRDLRSRLQRLEKRKETLVLNLSDGVIDKEEFLIAKQQTLDDISRLNLEIVEAEKQVEVKGVDVFEKIKDFLKLSIDNPDLIGDNILKDVINKIVVTDNNIDVYLQGSQKISIDYESACVTDTGQI